jgi:glutaconyl-CoA/methylmalonyl-CoA decarboxylase subunit gamma
MKKLRITVDGHVYDVTVEDLSNDSPSGSDPAPVVAVKGTPQVAMVTSTKAPTPPANPAASKGKEVLSQVSGTTVSVDVAVGDQVVQAQQLITIEAMKMNTHVMAPCAGRVSEVLTAKGKSVLAGDVLVRLT